MKIAAWETFVVGNPPPSEGGNYFIFVKLVTDDGIVGYGECYVATFGPDVIVKCIDDMMERRIVGMDPHRIETMYREVYGAGFQFRPDTTVMGCFSGIEMALWDIIGKSAGKPVYDMLGGKVRERLRAYTYLYSEPGDPVDVYHDADLSTQRAVENVERGFTAIKFDPAGVYGSLDPRNPSVEALERCERFVRQIRDAVGPGVDMLFGTHGQFTTSGAIRMAQRLEKYEPLWFEEPTPPDMPEEMARVAQSTSIPIATGERLTTKYEFARVLRTGAASILQMNLGRVGGILEAKKIAGMAETHYAQIAPHLYCGPIVGAANVQIGACSPNFLITESIRDWGGFHAEILKTKMGFEDGHVIIPTAPGLGVELDEDVARANPYTGTALHLNPVYGELQEEHYP